MHVATIRTVELHQGDGPPFSKYQLNCFRPPKVISYACSRCTPQLVLWRLDGHAFLLHGIPTQPANGETPRTQAVADSMSRFVTRQSRRQVSWWSCLSARLSPRLITSKSRACTRSASGRQRTILSSSGCKKQLNEVSE
jgi:hypothetical protein